MEKLIDVHSHPLLPDYVAAMRATGAAPNDARVQQWTLRDHRDTMDEHGITTAMLSLPSLTGALAGQEGHRLARRLNEQLAAIVEQEPDRFGAFACVPLDDMDAALEETAYALDELGLDGVTSAPHFEGRYLGDPSYDPWFEELNRREVIFFVHPGDPPGYDPQANPLHESVLEFTFETTRMVTSMILSGARRRYPDINLIATHGGGTIPYLAHRISVAAQVPWIYRGGLTLSPQEVLDQVGAFHYDLTAATSKAQLDAMIATVPTDRLMMGFDQPMMPAGTIPPALAAVTAYQPFTSDQRSAVLHGNAERLFPRLLGSSAQGA